jgi:hypothetical protein
MLRFGAMRQHRSAMACEPTWNMPITGTSIPRNHNQPTATYGRDRSRNASTVSIPITTSEIPVAMKKAAGASAASAGCG